MRQHRKNATTARGTAVKQHSNRMSKPNNTARDRAIGRAYLSGLSMAKVAEQFGLHASRIEKILVRDGIPRRSRNRPAAKLDRDAALAQAYIDGKSTADLGRMFGISANRALQILRRMNVPRRDALVAAAAAYAQKVAARTARQPAAATKDRPEADKAPHIPPGVKVTICPAGKDQRFSATGTETFFRRGGRLPPSPWVVAITGGR